MSHKRDPLSEISGDLARLIRKRDWSTSPAGPIANWTPALLNTLFLMLSAQAQIVLFWGPQYVAFYNDAYAPTIGDKHPRALGRPAHESWSELWGDLEPLLRGVRESGKTFAAKDRPFYIERRGFGETVYFDVSYSAVREADGTIGGVLCIVSETTARVLAEQKARADRDRFAEMFRQAPSFMALLDGPEHIFTLTNDAYQQLIGHRDATGKSIRDALPDLEGQGFYELLDEVYRSGKPYVGHDVAVSLQPEPGGKSVKRVLDFVYQPIKSTHGDVTGIFVEGHDITGTHLAERALGESEQRFNDIADATPVLIWISDTTKACTWFNKTWLDFTGRTMAQEMGNGWAEGVHPEDYDRCLATYVSAFDKHEPFRMLYRLRRHDGEWRVVDDNGVPRFTADGTFMGFIGSCIDVTDERAAQDAINHSEERLRLATENAGIGLFDIDPDGGIDFSYSRRSSTFLMDREKRVPMEHLFSRLHPEDVSRTRAIYEAARDPSRRERFDVEYRVVPEADQPMRWIKIRGRGVFDDAGKLLRISGTAIDISKEQEIQDALRRSEEQLRLASDNAEIGLWDMDVLHNTAYSTPRVKMIFGMPTDSDPAPDEFFALVHPDDIARVQSAYADAFDPVKRATYDIAYRVTGRDDGVLRWIHAKGRGVFDADGLLQRVTGTAADVTEQKEIAEALRRSEEQLRLATEYSEIGLWDIDIVNDIVYWPPRVNMMFGLAPDEAVTMKQFRASLHPEDKRKTIAHILEACDPAKRTFYDAEYRITRKSDGIVRWMAAKGRAVFDDQRRCVRMLGIIADVTERKEIEQRIHELNETLEKRVVERTAALEKSQAALQQAQKMEAIGNLTGGIAHDFNNLLQGLSGNLDLIRRRPDDTARVQRWAESGLQAAERGAKLTAQLLTFSRSQKLELRALDLAELLPSMRELLKRTLGPSVEVALDLEPGKQAVLGDETQLEMAVLNLAINARDAMPDGGKLSISTKSRTLSDDAELAPGDYVELSVSDTGSGMAADVMTRAFDPFFTTKGVGKGTGLGLSQVYGMIRQAGGTARIQSTSGKGTTVSLFLRKTSQSASIAVQHDHDRPADKTHTAKILVIDDDPGVRQFLNDSLSAFGYNVSEAENGPAGLSLLQSFVPDLTVIDFAMPGMTGAEVAKKARMQRPDLPVIFASGYADTEAIESQRDEHTAVLRKPFRISELQDAITRLLIR